MQQRHSIGIPNFIQTTTQFNPLFTIHNINDPVTHCDRLGDQQVSKNITVNSLYGDYWRGSEALLLNHRLRYSGLDSIKLSSFNLTLVLYQNVISLKWNWHWLYGIRSRSNENGCYTTFNLDTQRQSYSCHIHQLDSVKDLFGIFKLNYIAIIIFIFLFIRNRSLKALGNLRKFMVVAISEPLSLPSSIITTNERHCLMLLLYEWDYELYFKTVEYRATGSNHVVDEWKSQ